MSVIPFILSTLSSGAPSAPLPYNPNLVELLGQSNAAGAASINDVQEDLEGPLAGCKIFNTTSLAWETIEGGVNNSALSYGHQSDGGNAFGVELRLMKLLRAYYGVDQYLIKYTLGGTGLAQGNGGNYGLDWSPSSTDEMYEQSNENSTLARSLLSDTKPPKCIIIIQGEQDALSSDAANAYQSNLESFISAKRTFYGYPIPFIIVRLGDLQTGYSYKATVRTAQETVAAQANNYLVSADGLSTTDGSHYNAADYDTLAERIFDVLITI